MNNLLIANFIPYYLLHVPNPMIVFKDTNQAYFELKDDHDLIYYQANQGIARYTNVLHFTVRVINYEAFINILPEAFRNGRKVCDLVVYTDNAANYFSLNELTDTLPIYVDDFTNPGGPRLGKRNKAIQQLYSTLVTLTNVPVIRAFINGYQMKKCIFFNKQTSSPQTLTGFSITATTSFNRLNTVTQNGFQMANTDIENLGFQLFEYTGNKTVEIN